MKIDKKFLSKIHYNGTLNKKQLDILNIDLQKMGTLQIEKILLKQDKLHNPLLIILEIIQM